MRSLPSAWVKVTLADVAIVQTGLSKSANRQGESVSLPYLRVANVQDGYLDLGEVKYIDVPAGQLERFRLHAGDVLLTEGGDFDKLGRGCVWNGEIEDCVHQNHVFAVRVSDENRLVSAFFALVIQSERARAYFISCAKQTTNLASINSSQIKQLPMRLPPLAVQREIVRLVDEYDLGIGLAENLLFSLKRRKQGLMQQLLTGRRRLKGFKGKWKSMSIGSFATHASNINKSECALPVLSCTKYNGLVDSLSYFGKQIFSQNTSTYKLVARGQFAYATNHIEEGSIGYQGLYDAALISPMYTVFEVNAAAVDHGFLHKLLKTEAMRRVFESSTHGSVARRGSLRWPEFAKLKITVPPLSEQTAIASLLDVASKEIELVSAEIAQLRTQKRALMQKLLSGDWRMPKTALLKEFSA